MRRALPAVLLVLGAALASVAAPLLTYGTTLALFGGAHVLTELRFVDRRFSGRLSHALRLGLGLLLAGIVVLRAGKNLGAWGGTGAVQVELAVVLGLGALVMPALWRAGVRPLLIGGGLLALLAWGLLQAPVLALLSLACLHNWTPVGFLAEGLPRAARARGLALACLVFGLLPLLILSGLPARLLPGWPELSLLSTGPLARNMGAYLPSSVQGAPWALDAFRALVFAQCMHYAAVLGVLPGLAPPGARGITGLGWPSTRVFALAVGALSLVALGGWALDFGQARSWYGLVAAVHAWVEVPVLLLALVPASAAGALRAPGAAPGPG